ncbi:MAG: TonB family protein [Candidatus Binatia bacterium]
MTEDSPVPLGQPEWDRGLWWMVLASGAVHLLFITLLLVIPQTFLHRPPALRSYTVDLIAPDRIGGTNMIAGGKGRVEGAPLAAAPKVEPPKPPPKVEEPKPPQPKPEPQKVEPPPEPVKEAAKPQPKPEPPKTETKPKENEAVLAEKVKKVEPPPAPTVAKPAPTPRAKPAAQPKAVAKAEPAKPQAPAESKKAAEAAKGASKEASAAHARDEKIEAAIKRVEQQIGKRGAGSGTKPAEQPGGPISVGPGEGAGGTVKGVEYLLYYNQMINRIKQIWAWAGANRTLEASVRFNITEAGEVVNARITRASGDPSYDASVERAVRAANPLPAPPEAYRKEFSDVELIFRPDDLKM